MIFAKNGFGKCNNFVFYLYKGEKPSYNESITAWRCFMAFLASRVDHLLRLLKGIL